MIVEWDQTDTLKQDQWVQVRGPVDAVSFEGNISPIIRAETVELVSQPDQPYLYP
jgi:putative membrane protein